jgi:hypothetical protein
MLLTILSLICCAYPADLDEGCVMEVEWDWPKDGSSSVLDGGLHGHWSQGMNVHVTPETRMSEPHARHALHHLGGIPRLYLLDPAPLLPSAQPKPGKNLCPLEFRRKMRATHLPPSHPPVPHPSLCFSPSINAQSKVLNNGATSVEAILYAQCPGDELPGGSITVHRSALRAYGENPHADAAARDEPVWRESKMTFGELPAQRAARTEVGFSLAAHT